MKSTCCGHGHRGTKVLLPFLLLSHVSNEWNIYMNINSFTRIHCIIYNQCPECFFFEESCMLKINKSSFFGLNFSFFSEWQIYMLLFFMIYQNWPGACVRVLAADACRWPMARPAVAARPRPRHLSTILGTPGSEAASPGAEPHMDCSHEQWPPSSWRPDTSKTIYAAWKLRKLQILWMPNILKS